MYVIPLLLGSRFRFPSIFKHFAVGGGSHTYATETLQSIPYSPIGFFQLPVTPLLPADTAYDGSPDLVPVSWNRA